MVKKSVFPKKLYVYIDEDGEEKYFIANDSQLRTAVACSAAFFAVGFLLAMFIFTR